MKAAQYKSYGGSEVVVINEGVSLPEPGSDQILVDVFASSLNPFDSKLRSGNLSNSIALQFPVTPGGDFSGIVKKFGSEVTGFEIGDKIYGQALIVNKGSGSIAEMCLAGYKSCALKPKNLDFTKSSALPLVGSSSIQALEEIIELKREDKILIHGGAGGIGHISIQLAKHLGAYVATTVSRHDMDFAKSLGADVVIDYSSEKFEEKVSGYNAVYDTVGGDTTMRSFRVLKKGGILVSMLGEPDPVLAQEYGITSVGQNSRVTKDRLDRLTELVETETIKPHIDKIFTLDRTRDAFEYLDTGHPRGKVVVKIK